MSPADVTKDGFYWVRSPQRRQWTVVKYDRGGFWCPDPEDVTPTRVSADWDCIGPIRPPEDT